MKTNRNKSKSKLSMLLVQAGISSPLGFLLHARIIAAS